VTLAVVGLVAEAIFLEIMARLRALPLLDQVRGRATATESRSPA